jgi:hypothetical protein
MSIKYVAKKETSFRHIALRELCLFLCLLFVGLVLLPVGIYLVGDQVFGAYGGYGFSDFFGTISGKIRAGDWVAWFLILSPYLTWQTIRLTALFWRVIDRSDNGTDRKTA